MERNGRHAAIGVTELLVRTSLSNFDETKSLEQRDHLPRLEDWKFRHDQATRTV
jgi:hypothetical protein